MALHMRQDMRMKMEQKLKLTPQMIQSIEILLLPQMALEERIMSEVEVNPVLELQDGPEDGPEDGLPGTAEADRAADESQGYDGERHRTSAFEEQRQAELDHERYADWLKSRREFNARGDDAPDKMEAINATAGPPCSLSDHVFDQVRMADVDARAERAARELCWALDRRGYLTDPLTSLVDEADLDAAERAWEVIRGCDPAGIGARDLRDCLLLQLEREPGDNSFELALVRDHLDDVLRNRLPVVAAAMGTDVERIQEGVEVIARLDPQPGLAFAAPETQFVVPDVVVDCDENGEWVVSVPDTNLPKVEINQAYYQLYNGPEADPREREYLKEKLAGARFIIDAVQQRKRTLLKIATEIVKHQQDFLNQGPEHLRPLMRQNIADRIGMHVATVSRAVKDKYIQTPAGVLPLSSFFSGGIATQDGGEAESSRSVKLKIKAMIEKEEPRRPLSDQAIADALAKEGLDISRRTVTKYRIAEGIPSTRQRRRFAD